MARHYARSRQGSADYYRSRQVRTYPCPTCKRPHALSYREMVRGYQCADCTRREEANCRMGEY